MPDPAISDAMSETTIHTLRLSPALRDQMVIHMVREAPNEGVGLLAITQDAGIARATAYFAGENIDASPTRFTMHPRDVVTALDTISERGWTLGAIVHSHLKGSATPSRTDLDEAHYPDALMVIVSLAHLPPDVRVWRLDSEGESVVKRRVELDVSDADTIER
ncbi:MAG: M67 family metallopeptidase [Chloroflexota bacterium]|jgi:proteasome lid subunit RPN8/RPN11|nr:M67 family metallopeptidase [Chloroflexota bacterium]